jgi:hypothetical protein
MPIEKVKVLTMSNFRTIRAFAISSLAAITAMSAVALTTNFAAAEQTAEAACTNDVMRLCQQFVPDHGQIATCLFKNRKQLSPACRTVMTPKASKHQKHASN